MIGMIISGCCNNCPHIDLDLDSKGMWTGEHLIKQYSLCCTHEKVCGRLEKEQQTHPLQPGEDC